MELIASTLRMSTPLLFAAMGGLFCERAGVATICLEGVMLLSAWVAAVVNFYTHDPYQALTVALMVGGAAMSVHAFLCITAKADHIISGLVVNLFAAGLTPILCNLLFSGPTNSPNIDLKYRIKEMGLPLLAHLPVVGSSFFEHVPLVYLAFGLPFLVHFIFYRTRFGLRIQASGDAPGTLRTVGVSPEKVRYLALIVGGMVCSLGGAFLSIAHTSQFTRDMTAGRGFIALAAIIFGKWRPLPTMVACLFFGFTEALQISFQNATLWGSTIPIQFIQAIPYLVTLVVLVVFVGKMKAPLAIGKRLEA